MPPYYVGIAYMMKPMGRTHGPGTLIDTCTALSEFGDVARARRWLSHMLRFPSAVDFDN